MHSFTKKYHQWLWVLALVFAFSCEENAIPLSLDDSPLNLDTASFAVSQIVSYQSPPEMGGTDYLYFGNEDGYDHPYALIQIKQVNSSNSVSLKGLSDSLITVDSAELFLNFEWDSTAENETFQLRYFPLGGDSVFNESMSHYKNFDPSSASEIISTTGMEVDSSDTNFTSLQLRFPIETNVLMPFMDTSLVDFNRTFLVEPVNNLNGLLRFISRENVKEKGPLLKVFYRKVTSDSELADTLSAIFNTDMDLSMTIPPIPDTPDSVLSVGKAMGLKTLAFVDMDSFTLPEHSVIKSADLILHPIDGDSIDAYFLIAYPLETVGDYSGFKSFPEDPYEMNLNYFVSTPMINNQFNVNTRSFVFDMTKGNVTNNGFKLYSSTNNDPFDTIHFYGIESDSFYPVMRIQYVVP